MTKKEMLMYLMREMAQCNSRLTEIENKLTELLDDKEEPLRLCEERQSKGLPV